MSDTTSFLGGAAFAGLAALLVMKGGISIGAPTLGTSQPLAPAVNSPVAVAPQPAPAPAPVPSPVVCPTPSPTPSVDAGTTEQLKSQTQQLETLKAQLQNQQTLIENLTTQIKSTPPAVVPSPSSLTTAELANPILTGLLWALGGVVLTLGGGVILVGMFVLVARQQSPRNSRTVEVIHTPPEMPPYLATRRRPQLPASRRVVTRRVHPSDIQ